MPVYPLSLRLDGRRVVVVGGGPVAFRRVAGLRSAGADILVVSPRLSPTLGDLADRGLIAARLREYRAGDLDGAWLALACTDQPRVNAAVAADAERLRIWCVRADDAAASAAWVPAVGRSGAVTVAVNAGRNPRRAAELRDRLVATVEAAGRTAAEPGQPAAGPAPRAGLVSIVGGGPGDPGLITVTGLDRLRAADVVVADRLAPLDLLERVPLGAQVIDAAKVPGGPAMRQDQINHALVEHARAGRAVVRLKGGDPFVFGRGREELEACLAAGVPVEVIPGVTSAISVPAAAGIPVTHRGLSQGFCVLAGHVRPGDPRSSVDWAALARSGMTLVLLMAIDHLDAIADALLAAGLGGDTPCAAVSDGWTRRQRVATASLRDLAATVKGSGIKNPAVIVIGEVAQLVPDSPARPASPAPAPDRTGPAHPGTGTAPVGPAPPRAEPSEAPVESAASPGTARRVLVLGGARSGKSRTAEAMLAGHARVDYVATGLPPGSGDGEWDARIREHQRRRAAHWHTVETLALAELLAPASGARSLPAPPPAPPVTTAASPVTTPAPPSSPVTTPAPPSPPVTTPAPPVTTASATPGAGAAGPGAAAPVLIDCLTTWLARVMDECGAWDGGAGADRAVAARVDGLLDAWRRTSRHVVAVSNEIGSGVVPETASGRRFRDELGRLNARIAADSDEVWLCTAGIPRRLR